MVERLGMFDKKAEILIFFVFVFFSALVADAAIETSAVTQGGPDLAAVSETSKQGELLSPLAAKTFYDIGYELYTAKDADFTSAEQAIIFFDAAVALDSKAGYVLPDIINIAWQYPDENFSDAVKLAMNEYIDRSADLEVASKAVGYLLERLDSRERRQELLTKLLYQFQQKNTMFASDISAQLGFLTAETADATNAQMYLVKAFTANKYNRLAFAKLAELADKGGQPLPDISYLQNLRFAVRANPLDFDSAIRFAQYTEMLGLYEPASAAYEYCVDLLKYLSGPNSIGPDIYRPWLLNCYNARQYSQCRQILSEIRDKGIFDVQAEAITSAAISQGGDKDSSDAILAAIKAHSNKILAGKLKVSSAELEDFVWFYSFVADVNADQTLTWATKAYDAEPNSVNAASLFAYALAMNNQTELAGSMLEKIGTPTRTAELAKAIVLLQRQDVISATGLLKKVVETAPGSFEAQKAKAKLKELGAEYIPPIDSAAIVTVLQNDFGQAIFSQFVEPQKMVSVEFNIKGNTFSYGSEITGNLVIINKYTEPIVVCPDAMIKGNIRIDAKIAGDFTEQIPALIVKTVRPSYEIKPGDALFIPLRLDTGKVKCILDCHPQAQLNLEYTAYIDPQITANGRITNALAIKPAKVIIARQKLNLNTHYLQQRFEAIKKGHQGQKAKSAQLFAGLLAEQQNFRRSGPAYRFIYAEPQLLSSALAKCLSENDWILKVQTIAAMQILKLDYRLTEVISEELENPNWPVRLIAVFSLAQNKDEKFMPVLSWVAKNDPHPLVKGLAAALSGNVETDLPAAADSNNINPQIEQKAQQEPSSENRPN
ncbi:MAG: hypothetical protein WCE45_02410 [Sedimentisphaerales bacterium]